MSQRTQRAESQAAATNGGFVAVGHRPIRHDGVDKVTGKAMYGADISLPGMLYGAMLRSPHAHARIISIDTSKAEANPDVKAVATSADLALWVGEAGGGGGGRRHEHPVHEQQHSCCGQGALQGPRGGCGGRLQPARGGGGPCAHRRDIRGAAGGHDRGRGDEGRRPYPPRPPGRSVLRRRALPRRATSPSTSSSSWET